MSAQLSDFRSWTVTSNAEVNACVIPYPCVLDAIVLTRVAPTGTYKLYDAVGSSLGRIVFDGRAGNPLAVSRMRLRLDVGLWLVTAGTTPITNYFAFIAAQIFP